MAYKQRIPSFLNGYVCDHPNLYGCQSGCNHVNSKCVADPNINYGLYYCQCDDGYTRIREDLPCVPQDHSNVLMENISVNQITIETYNEIETEIALSQSV